MEQTTVGRLCGGEERVLLSVVTYRDVSVRKKKSTSRLGIRSKQHSSLPMSSCQPLARRSSLQRTEAAFDLSTRTVHDGF